MGVNAAHDIRRVFFEDLVARQIARGAPQEVAADGGAREEEYDAGREEKSEDIQQQAAALALGLALHGRKDLRRSHLAQAVRSHMWF